MRANVSLWKVIGVLIIVSLLTAGGVMLYRSGWAQGYAAGSIAAMEEGEVIEAPLPAFGGLPYMWGLGIKAARPMGLLLGLSIVLRLGLVLLLIAFILRMLRFRRWHMHGPSGAAYGSRRGPWAPGGWPHGPWHHGPPPGWCGGEMPSGEEEPKETEERKEA